MTELESLLSRYIPESEVSRLNATGSVVDASPELLELLELAGRISAMGDGAFDITVQPVLERYRQHLAEHHELPSPDVVEQALEQVGYGALRVEGRRVAFDRPGMGITPDGIGKGYVIDQGVAELKRRGYANVLVEAGGDLVASGRKDADTPWRVGIRSPRPGLELQARFDAEDQAVTTSGDYMQPFTDDFAQHHILDPRTGYSAPELASSTVVAPTAALADGLSTLTMVLGPKQSVELIEGLANCEGYFVTKELEVVQTSGFRVVV
jgi:thiamine biosynthesis lipoprotein